MDFLIHIAIVCPMTVLIEIPPDPQIYERLNIRSRSAEIPPRGEAGRGANVPLMSHRRRLRPRAIHGVDLHLNTPP